MYHICYKKENKEKEIVNTSHKPIPKDMASDVKVSFKACSGLINTKFVFSNIINYKQI